MGKTAKEQAAQEGVTPQAIYMRRYRERHNAKSRQYQHDFNENRRRQVIEHYGGRCECCGEDEFAFLCLDHKDGGGTQHRKETGMRGASMIGWIIRNDYPDTFRVLCWNCNQARGYYGRCPHGEDE